MTTQEEGREKSSDESVEKPQESAVSWSGFVEVAPRPEITETEAGKRVLELIRAEQSTHAAGRRSIGAMLRHHYR
jgi:hypothetical protein